MVYEVVISTVAPAQREEYIAAWRAAWLEAAAPGAHNVAIMPCIEDPARVITMIEWDSVEAHEKQRTTAAHGRFRDQVQRYRTGPSDLKHYLMDEFPTHPA